MSVSVVSHGWIGDISPALSRSTYGLQNVTLGLVDRMSAAQPAMSRAHECTPTR